MTERRSGAAWDVPAVAALRRCPNRARTAAVLGDGVVFRLGATPPVDLELYEQARTVRMTGGEVQIALFHQDGPTVAPEGILFELRGAPRRRFVAVAPGGAVSLVLAPPAGAPHEAAPGGHIQGEPAGLRRRHAAPEHGRQRVSG